MSMKCLKVEDYVRRTACPNETRVLCNELESFVKNGVGATSRALCDRVIRACNERLGAASLCPGHLDCVMGLVEVALRGYASSKLSGLQADPLYMEKILFHILKKVAAHGSHTWSTFLGDLLYDRLALAAVTADLHLLAQSCFAVLLSVRPGEADSPPSPERQITHELKAVRFLLLREKDPQAPLKVAQHAEEAAMRYVKACGVLREAAARHLLEQIRLHLLAPGEAHRPAWPTLCQVSLCACRHLGQAGLWDLAAGHLERDTDWMRSSPGLALALDLALRATGIHSAPPGQRAVELTECARSLRAAPAELGQQERHLVLQGCSEVTRALEVGQCGPLGAQTLLACFSFLEEYQELLEKHIQLSTRLQEQQKHYQTLCSVLQQGLFGAYDSLEASKLEKPEALERVLLFCQSAASRLVCALQKVAEGRVVIKSASAINEMVRSLFNRKLYDQAFSLAEILGQELRKNRLLFLPVEKVNRTFMQAVLCSRRAGQLERALDWVGHWLQALGDRALDHMAEPISQWAKIKAEAARAGQEDIRLRTLRDSLGPDGVGEEALISLLEEELRAYCAAVGDTAQERYNVLCDLLELRPEGGGHASCRARYLCDMARVVCFQDFSEQTDCSAVDFTQEALRLLEEEPGTIENSDRLKDQKAQALLWFYICTLEKNLQEAKVREPRLAAARKRAGSMEPLGTNDLDYEDKQKQQDSMQVYDSLRFNLAAQSKQCQSLDQALGLWRALLAAGPTPAVRCSKQTLYSVELMGALYQLMGKPLQALESHQLAVCLSRGAGDARSCASSLCQSTRLLLELGAPQLAQVQLEQVEQLLQAGGPSAEGPTPLDLQAVLLKAQLCHSTGQVELGVALLSRVLEKVWEPALKSKQWYLLRAQAMQTVSSYLSLDTSVLPPCLRQRITKHGLKSADTAMDESLKWLCSLVVTLLGNHLYGTSSDKPDVRFIDQANNVLLKWQLLSEVLSCSLGVVAVRSHCGTVPEAKARCLEALKLATKLQTLSPCAELLVVKAELELQAAELDQSRTDLEQVESLLDLCTDFGGTEKKAGLKIKAQKARLPKKPALPPGPSEEEDSGSFLHTRAFPREPVATNQECGLSASPPLKARPERWLSSLGHAPYCACPCCSDPRLGRVVVRWAAARAELTRQLRQEGSERRSRSLFLAALSRSKAATAKLGASLSGLVEPGSGGPGAREPSFLHDLMAKIHLRMALACLEPQGGTGDSWELLEAGLAFVRSQSSSELAFVRARLQAAQALASILALASKQGCRPEELFSSFWTWNPQALPKLKPCLSVKKTKKAKEPAPSTLVPKPKVTFPSGKIKTDKTAKAVAVTPGFVATPRDIASAFNFDDEVPLIGVRTPAQKVRPARSARGSAAKPGPKPRIQVYDESSPPLDKLRPVPAAPRRTKRCRFKVDFSDDSEVETEAPPPALACPTQPRSKASSAASKPSAHSLAPAPGPKTPGRSKRSTALPPDLASEEDSAPPRTAPRRGRPRKPAAACPEEPERMRTIQEEVSPEEVQLEELSVEEVQLEELSMEEMRASDTEEQREQGGPPDVPDKDFEVLRREPVLLRQIEGFQEIRNGVPSPTTPLHPAYPSTGPGDVSLDGVRELLQRALLSLQHLPTPSVYVQLCGLLALCLGQTDPVTTALLHTQSLGLTARHLMIRHVSSRLGKLRKASSADLAARLRDLSLDEPVAPAPLSECLARLEAIFSFPTLEPEAFPRQLGLDFSEQLRSIPSGVTVCLLSVVSAHLGEMGDTILLSRLERGSPPITVRIPTAQCQRSVSAMLQELDSVLKKQKELCNVTDKTQWWDGRKALDQRIERLLEDMRDVLGSWQVLLLPMTSDPRLPGHAKALLQTLTEHGVQTTEETLKAVLSASPLLSPRDLQSLAGGLCGGRGEESLTALQGAVSALKDRTEPQGHVVLVLDKYLQKLPWESISCLRSRTVTRMPSLHFVLGHCALKELHPGSVLSVGVDPQQAYYVLNADANLENTEKSFREWFTSESGWQGVCGIRPSLDQLQQAISTKDLYIYIGHGAGSRFLDSHSVLRQEFRAAALLIGCSSAALSVQGELEGNGIILSYLMAGCPAVVGNLWDVTDRDIDRFTTVLLQGWLAAGRGSPLLDHMAASRQSTYLKHLIGAAPVVYGLPISRK